LAHDVWGYRVHTLPPNSQGYLTLATTAIAEANGLGGDPGDPTWPHVLIHAARLAGCDRSDVLHDRADGEALLARALARSRQPHARAAPVEPLRGGSTTYLCALDGAGMGVSLIQSNASGFGSWLVEPGTGINLHNRGIGFSLEPGHPAELGPGRRPPHTLAPTLVTRADESLAAIVGSAGGDAQPQIVAQLLARILLGNTPVADAVGAGRWVLRSGPTGFDTWSHRGADARVLVEGGAPAAWFDGLRALGHDVEAVPAGDGAFGHGHAIVIDATGEPTAATEPRIAAQEQTQERSP
jgi:gamma-glutamyltranspeptidase/glutathione hydrolase